MSPEELLRRYLEQRREIGERELVLDGLSVDEVMRIIGAAGRGGPRPETNAPAVRPGGTGGENVAGTGAGGEFDWRAVLSAAEAAATPNETPEAPPEPRRVTESEPRDGIPSVPAPTGLVVGGGGRELFGGPFGDVSSLEQIAGLVQRCTRCELYKTATQGVPGEGNPEAKLMCVGEAPGATEDATGRPFVGQAGQLLTKILAAISLSREDVFIANVLKHRPPGNRNRRPEEVAACTPYLVRQIELIRPKVIIAFGTFAAQSLLETKLAIGKLRGAVHRYHGVPVVVTYHPAALLRNPAWKRPTWEDVQLARRILDSATA